MSDSAPNLKTANAAERAWQTRRHEEKGRGASPLPTNDLERAVIRASQNALARARRKGVEYSPDLPARMLDRYRKTGGRCSVSGVPFSLEVHGHGAAPRPFVPSIDRIDSSGGYTSGNTRLVVWAVNCFCGVWGADIALQIARGIVETQQKGQEPFNE